MAAFLDDWVLKPEYLPAWLQAGAAIVALGISVCAVLRTEAVARRRDRREIRGLAVTVYPEIEMLKISTKRVRDRVAQIMKRDSNLSGQSVMASLQVTTHIQVPPMLERNIDKLFILGDVAGPSCVDLVRRILQYNDTAENTIIQSQLQNAGELWRRGGALSVFVCLEKSC